MHSQCTATRSIPPERTLLCGMFHCNEGTIWGQVMQLFIKSFISTKRSSKSGENMVTAFVLCVTDAGKERDVVKLMKAMPNVEEAYVVYGEYDVIAKIRVDELKLLDTFITENVRTIPSVQMTSTMIAI